MIIGGAGGTGGNGASSSATNDGVIMTAGHHSYGVIAQSIGGGGGYGGSVVMGPVTTMGSQVSNDGGEGDGGNVTVTATGNITTAGGSSVGIFAQSVCARAASAEQLCYRQDYRDGRFRRRGADRN